MKVASTFCPLIMNSELPSFCAGIGRTGVSNTS